MRADFTAQGGEHLALGLALPGQHVTIPQRAFGQLPLLGILPRLLCQLDGIGPLRTPEQPAKQGDHAKVVAAQAQINAFQTALGTYKLETSQFPSTDQGLAALRNKPGDLPNWNGPYLPKDIPNDPWGRPYIYKYPGDHGDEPDIISYGADGQPGGDGINADILSWSNAK